MILLMIISKTAFIQFSLDVYILLVLTGSEALVPKGGTLSQGKIHSHGSMKLKTDMPPLAIWGSLVTDPTSRGDSITG